jgi:hypothetical protein
MNWAQERNKAWKAWIEYVGLFPDDYTLEEGLTVKQFREYFYRGFDYCWRLHEDKKRD